MAAFCSLTIMRKSRISNRVILFSFLLGLLLLVILARVYYMPQTDEYQYRTPPPGPNARPDKPNPAKLKQLPGANHAS